MRRKPCYQPGDRIAGRYQVHQVLMGGMGEVYLCLDLEEMYPYALKTFQRRYLGDPQRLRRAFEREVATWVALEKHPNIVRCFYMKTFDNQPFMVLEWIAGEEGRGTDLRGWLRRGPLDLRLVLDFAIDICRGLIHAQEKQPGIIHRDLKPENILVAQGGLAKITDFGLAQIVDRVGLEVTGEDVDEGRYSLTGQGGIVGTPPYMAPEQWRNESLDVRTDIYAVGCILYEMLTGERPFQANTLDGLRRQHLEANIPKMKDERNWPRGFAVLLARCLTKRREQRWSTMDDLLQQLALAYQRQFAEPPKTIRIDDELTAIDYTNRGNTYYNLQRNEDALADHNRAIHLAPTLPQPYHNRGVTFVGLHRYDDALADFSQAIALNPTLAQAYHHRGATYIALQQYNEALVDCNQAIRLEPALAQAYSNRGAAYYKLQRYDEALADFNQAIQLEPSDARAYYDRGLIYQDLRRHKEALLDFSRAIELDPNDAATFNNRGLVYADLQRYKEALADYDKAVELDPNWSTAHYNRGLTYARSQQYGKALTDFSRAIQLDPFLVQAHIDRGLIYVNMQHYEEALADYNRAIQIDPTNARAYYSRGNTYCELQQYEKALADYNQAIKLDPTNTIACINIGAVLGNQGRLREALPYFEKAAKLGDSQGAQYAAQVRQTLGLEAKRQIDPAQQAFEAFQQAGSAEAMQQTVVHFPFMAQADFIAAIEQAIAQQVPPELRLTFEQRLAWLRQIASGKRSGFLGRLFGKRK